MVIPSDLPVILLPSRVPLKRASSDDGAPLYPPSFIRSPSYHVIQCSGTSCHGLMWADVLGKLVDITRDDLGKAKASNKISGDLDIVS